MKNKILYIALAIIFLVAIYFVTVTQVLISNQNEFNENIYKTARETKDFDEFLAVQVKQYLKLDEISNDDYKMALYQITDNEDDQKIVIILVPLRTVNFASSAEDINDKSQIIVKNLTSDDEIFNTKSFNTVHCYDFLGQINHFGKYIIELEISSNLPETTQMPFSIYANNKNKQTLTTNGTGGNKIKISAQIVIDTNTLYLSFKIHKTGIAIHNISVIKHG